MKEFVQSCMRARLEKLEKELRGAADNPEDQKAIHDLRVAIRRFSQFLRTFAQFFAAERVKTIRHRLRKLMDRCGAVRNCDIALELLHDAGLPDGSLTAHLAKQRSRAQRQLARRLPSWCKRWHTHLHADKDRSGIWDANQSVEENARRVLPALAEELFKAGDGVAMAGSGYLKLHRFRLQVKRFRYTFEVFQHDGMERGDEMLRGLQDKLGAISDCGATLKLVKRDRRATAAVRKLLTSREAEFRKYWKRNCGPRIREWFSGTGDLVACLPVPTKDRRQDRLPHGT